MKIYNTARAAPTPALNALATLLLLAALTAVVIGFLVYRYMTRSDTTTRTRVSAARSPEGCNHVITTSLVVAACLQPTVLTAS